MYAAGLVVSAVIGGSLALGGAALLGGIGTSTGMITVGVARRVSS